MIMAITKAALASAISVLLIVPALGAQTRFDYPAPRVDVTHFRYVENCMAAATRVRDSLKAADPADRDTIPVRDVDQSNPIAPEVLNITQKCLEKFTPEQIPVPFTQVAQKSFLYAGRDADAEKIIQLRLQKISDSTSRAFILDSFARNYISASPRRVTEAHAIVDDVLTYGNKYRGIPRISMCVAMVQAAVEMGDDATIQKYGKIALASLEALTPDEVDNPGVQIYLSLVVRHVIQQVYKTEILDSLRSSTKAFVDIQATKFKQVAKSIRNTSDVGSQMVPLVAEYWFPETAAATPYPRKGKISIVNFPSSELERYDKQAHVVIRRLGVRYPEADLVLAGRTQGFFGPRSEREAKIDAEKQSKLFKEYRGNTKAVLGIAISEIVDVPPPDKRRIHLLPANYDHYPKSSNEKTIFIVDEDGILVEHLPISGMYSEIWLESVMQVLMERHKQQPKS